MKNPVQHPFRTHTCGELSIQNTGEIVRLSGWIHRKRDHGNLLFIDLRDHYGITQLVIENTGKIFKAHIVFLSIINFHLTMRFIVLIILIINIRIFTYPPKLFF